MCMWKRLRCVGGIVSDVYVEMSQRQDACGNVTNEEF